ncbi:MAG: signal peptidase I [Clostridia bacterium]|nr:signal peptidase I [Clostridia bacterium]
MANENTLIEKTKQVFSSPKVKKGFDVTKTVLVWLVVAVAIFMMVFTIISVNTVDKNGSRDIFGYQFYVVKSDSMKATHFKAGDIIICRTVDVNTLEAGDIITFISENPDESNGQAITHMILEKHVEDGVVSFTTYGTTKGPTSPDDARATIILGEYKATLPNLGFFFQYLKTTPGYIICILIPFLLLILSQGINCIRLFRAYRKEQTDALEEERAKIEAERAESQRMMAELLALKAQLEAKENGGAPQSDTTEDGE